MPHASEWSGLGENLFVRAKTIVAIYAGTAIPNIAFEFAENAAGENMVAFTTRRIE
jgi:hypothetical protein